MKEFVKEITSWNNHRPLLFLALEETEKGNVIEMGCGDGSTQVLHDYCKAAKRKLISMDSNKEYIDKYEELKNAKHKFLLVENWEEAVDENIKGATVVLIDHAPGEDRGFRLKQLEGFKGIVVCHDSEPSPCGGNYGWDFTKWKHVVHVKSPMNGDTNGTWATAVSNSHNISEWAGKTLEGIEISK